MTIVDLSMFWKCILLWINRNFVLSRHGCYRELRFNNFKCYRVFNCLRHLSNNYAYKRNILIWPPFVVCWTRFQWVFWYFWKLNVWLYSLELLYFMLTNQLWIFCKEHYKVDWNYKNKLNENVSRIILKKPQK